MEHLKPPFIEFVLHEAIVTGELRNVLNSCMNYWVEVLREDEERNRMWELARKMVDGVNEQSRAKREGSRDTKSKNRENGQQGTGMLKVLCCRRNVKVESDRDGDSDERDDGDKGGGGVSGDKGVGDKGVGDKCEGGSDGNGEEEGARGDSGNKGKEGSDGDSGDKGEGSGDKEKGGDRTAVTDTPSL